MAPRALLLKLPFPPSVNACWRAKGRSVYLTPVAREYRVSVANAVGEVEPLVGRLKVHMTATMPDRRKRDIDNYTKSAIDALEQAGVFCESDEQIDYLTIERAGVEKPGRLEVIIWEL